MRLWRRSATEAGGPATEGRALEPAAIRMAVTGSSPWKPARAFLTELDADGFATSVELPDLVVLRDGQREPLVVREQAGTDDELVITYPPDRIATALETLVRALLADGYDLDRTDGPRVDLHNDGGIDVHLTVETAARA